MQASGGTTPYVLSLTTGALPSGLSLNVNTGEISGTPTLEESQTFTVTVTDAVSDAVSQTLTINIGPEATGPEAPTGLSASVKTKGKNAPKVTLSWSTVGTLDSFNIYKSTTSGSGYSLIDSVLNGTATSYVETSVPSGTYYYVVTAIAGGAESVYSNETNAVVP